MAPNAKKVERGTLYPAGYGTTPIEVRPANGKKFTLNELQEAVGGYIECMQPAVRHTTVYVNEEGAMNGTALNEHTWKIANHRIYVALNGYAESWRVSGNALVVRKVPAELADGKAALVYQAVGASLVQRLKAEHGHAYVM
jgi:hypothetical protein